MHRQSPSYHSENKQKQPMISLINRFHKKHPRQRNTPISESKDNNVKSSYLLTLNDEESERIQLKNDLVRLAFETDSTLPFSLDRFNKGKVLDIGCGPGAWCIDVAKKYPEIQVIGVDCEECLFPDDGTLPKNCSFLKYNLFMHDFEPLFGKNTKFDYAHIRFMNLSLAADQYARVVQDCWRILKPGGYLELMEMDMMIYNAGEVTARLNKQVVEAAIARGFKPLLAHQLKDLLPKGAIVVLENYKSMPIGTWGGRIGVIFREDMLNVMYHSQTAVSTHFGWKLQEYTQHDLKMVTGEMELNRSYSNFHYISVQKPIISARNEYKKGS